VDCVSSGDVYTSCVAFIVLVGPRHNLVIRPDCVVLGTSDYEDMHLALCIDDSVVDAMGEAVKKTSRARKGREWRLTSGSPCSSDQT
jgi:hypothetical protein